MTPASRWLLMLLPFVLWGTAMAAMKPLLAGAGPLSVAWLRLLPAGLAVLLAAVVMGRVPCGWPGRPALAARLPDRRQPVPGLLTGVGNTGAGLGSVLIDSQPLLVALLARSLFGEAINPVGWVGLLVGLAGIVCLGLPAPLLQHLWLEGPSTLGVEAWSHGELWMLGAAVAMAVGTVLCRFAMAHSDPVAITGWHMLIGSFPLLGGSAMATVLDPGAAPFWPAWSRIDWGLMTYASLLGSALAYGLFFWFARQGDLTGFTALTFLDPRVCLALRGVAAG